MSPPPGGETACPTGAPSGPVAVTTPGGTAFSASSFTVVTVAKLTLKVAPLSAPLGRTVRASGTLSPLSLAGSRVKLTVQRKSGLSWVTVKTVWPTTKATGVYGWSYGPAKRGAYRVRTSIAASATHTAAATKWVAFRVY